MVLSKNARRIVPMNLRRFTTSSQQKPKHKLRKILRRSTLANELMVIGSGEGRVAF